MWIPGYFRALAETIRAGMSEIKQALNDQNAAINSATEAYASERRDEPRIVVAAPTEKERETSTTERKKDRGVQKVIAAGTSITAVATVVAAIGAGIYAHIAAKQLGNMQQTYGEIQKQTRAFKSANAINRASAIISQRAYVGIAPFPYQTQSGTDRKTGESAVLFVVGVDNSGNTPAFDVHAHINYAPRTSKLPKNFTYHDISVAIPPLPGMAITPDVTSAIGAHETRGAMPAAFRQTILSEIDTGKTFVYLWGRVTYRDVFGCRHQTDFCTQILHSQPNKNGQQLTASANCESHNCSDKDCPEFRDTSSDVCSVELNPFPPEPK
jgi:hypothetical protein